MTPYVRAVNLGVQGIRSTMKKKGKLRKLPRLMSQHELSSYWMFRGVTVSVAPGDGLVVLGDEPTTGQALLRALTGLLSPDEGSVEINARAMLVTRPRGRTTRALSIRQSIRMLAGLYGFTDREIRELTDPVIEMAGVQRMLGKRAEDCPKEIMDQVAFAIAVHAPVDVIALDRMVIVGQPRFAERCVPTLRELQKAGRALLFGANDPKEIRALGSNGLLLHDEQSRQVSTADLIGELKRTRKMRLRKARRRRRLMEEDDSDDDTAVF